jgi:hypothetical protein
LSSGAELRLLPCEAAPDLLIARYASREGQHPGHHDSVAIADPIRRLEDGEFEPLAIAAPGLRVDTTDGYRPDFESIVQFCLDPTPAGLPPQ